MQSTSKSSLVVLFLAAVAVAATFSTSSSQPPQPAAKKTIFSTLKVGQTITLYSKGASWDIATLDTVPDAGSHKVIEINDDFIVLKDIIDVAEVRIPIFAVRSVTDIHMKQK
jgi:hypothetical protein